jgi:hypothetical protein
MSRKGLERSVTAAGMMLASTIAAEEIPRNAVTAFAGQMTDNAWEEVATNDDVSKRDAYLAGLAYSRELVGRPDWALEIEGQVVKHFHAEHHWEFNGALVGRWRGFPWRETIPTSVAFGIGPSYATEVPLQEIARDGQSARLLIYWMAEFEMGLPDRPWSAIARLHHRSSGYGALAEDGGSNWLVFGIRRRF